VNKNGRAVGGRSLTGSGFATVFHPDHAWMEQACAKAIVHISAPSRLRFPFHWHLISKTFMSWKAIIRRVGEAKDLEMVGEILFAGLRPPDC